MAVMDLPGTARLVKPGLAAAGMTVRRGAIS